RGCAKGGTASAASSGALRSRRTLRSRAGEASAATAAGAGQACAAASPGSGVERMSTGARDRALAEIAYCEHVLATGGLSVLAHTLRDVGAFGAWDHYPPGDVFEPATGAQWFYHCHPAEEGAVEHGHFHCFVRPHGTDGPVHHLAAVGV